MRPLMTAKVSSDHSGPTPDAAERVPRWFLLFAGSDPTPRGGLADLVGTFTSEATARQAFRHIRLTQTAQRSWAQLAVVDGDHGIRTLSWFGVGAAPAGKSLGRPQTSIDQPERAAPLRRLRRLAHLGRPMMQKAR